MTKIKKSIYSLCIKEIYINNQSHMKTFTKINWGVNLDFDHTLVNIEKVRKDWTKREFFRLRVEGKSIYNTMFARLYDAKKIARILMKRKTENI